MTRRTVFFKSNLSPLPPSPQGRGLDARKSSQGETAGNERSLFTYSKSRRVGCKKCEVAKNIFSFNPRNQKSRRDGMSVENTFPLPKNPVGMTCRYREIFNSLNEDRHVIPTGFLIAFVLFSTDMSSLRDFIHSKTERCGSRIASSPYSSDRRHHTFSVSVRNGYSQRPIPV
ncbi:MAG: hypothetical protein LBQ01_01970 [Prevotellaceae bacterium]|jgi:hypothetical protein|nr:hypothetical protein [Prevotellaceae bacterium]